VPTVARMRKFLMPVLAALLAAAATASFSLADQDHGRHHARPYSIGLWGDLPYSDVQQTTGVPNLIADMNAQRLAFIAHDGDIKSGSTKCTDDVYTNAIAMFNSSRAPAIYTPGDNEWTDCDRPAAGSYDSLERLDHLRSTMFTSPYSFGQHRIRLQVQHAPYVENRRWEVGGVTYATLHVVGSDNDCEGDTTQPHPDECRAREAATIQWLRDTFAQAKHDRSAAVMFVMQANPGWDADDPNRAPVRDPKTLAPLTDGFAKTLLALREETIAFRRPVAVVHGDSHYFRIDKPFQDDQGRRLENFTRVETFGDHQENGDNDVQWLKVTVDPDSRDVFSFQPQIVPANRTAVPAP
jgi:hypothetical protein